MLLVHDTPESVAAVPAGLGLDALDQLDPFQRTTNVPEPEPPTAKQLVADGHDTPYSASFVPEGFGLTTSDQLAPFHCSTKVCVVLPLRARPTAKQLVVVAHDTRERVASVPAGLGVATVDQVLPFQRSANGLFVANRSPTARHSLAAEHETLCSRLIPGLVGFGLATVDQLEPFHCTVHDQLNVCTLESPTAKQLASLTHETPLRPPVLGTGAFTVV